LVCTGGAREAQPALEQQIAEHELQNQVRFLGYCPHGDLPALYRGAACLIFPSLFEGFGMPVLEAMACGCPVVCSNTSSLPEIAGDAALLVDPFDSEAIAAAAARLLREADLRADMRARGIQQAKLFSWQRHTRETVAVFYRVHRQIREL
jgi:glycosyltransferase involved in cell wall biosynthesis